jgi:hypothetical protein
MFLKRVSKRAPFRNPFECYTDCVIGCKIEKEIYCLKLIKKKAQLTPKTSKLYQIANEFRDIGRKLDEEATSYKKKF